MGDDSVKPDAGLAGLLRQATQTARQGGRVLLDFERRLSELQTEFKGRRTELVTEADRAAERSIVAELLADHPDHAILAEEGVLTPKARATRESEYLWLVDPLDGTTNYVHGLPFYAVSLCLVRAGQPIVGVVEAPALGWTFTAARGHGAEKNGQQIQVSTTERVEDALLATGFSYNRSEASTDDNVARLRRALHGSRGVRRYGSAALDLCLTAGGQLDAYWEMYLEPYDVAAGALVLEEAGGRVSDLAGGAAWLYGGEILASNGRIHGQMLDLVGGSPP